MGKGDARSRKGKTFKGSFGKSRRPARKRKVASAKKAGMGASKKAK